MTATMTKSTTKRVPQLTGLVRVQACVDVQANDGYRVMKQVPTFYLDLEQHGIVSPTGLDVLCWDLLSLSGDLDGLGWAACDDHGNVWTDADADQSHAGRLCNCRKCRKA